MVALPVSKAKTRHIFTNFTKPRCPFDANYSGYSEALAKFQAVNANVGDEGIYVDTAADNLEYVFTLRENDVVTLAQPARPVYRDGFKLGDADLVTGFRWTEIDINGLAVYKWCESITDGVANWIKDKEEYQYVFDERKLAIRVWDDLSVDDLAQLPAGRARVFDAAGEIFRLPEYIVPNILPDVANQTELDALTVVHGDVVLRDDGTPTMYWGDTRTRIVSGGSVIDNPNVGTWVSFGDANVGDVPPNPEIVPTVGANSWSVDHRNNYLKYDHKIKVDAGDDVALAIARLPSSGGIIELSNGIHASPYTGESFTSEQGIYDNIQIIGSGVPAYSTDEKSLEFGTIIQDALFLGGNRMSIVNLGIDVGEDFTDANHSGNARQGLMFFEPGSHASGQAGDPEWGGCHIEDIKILSRGYDTDVHAMLVENYRDFVIRNIWTLFGGAGAVIKSRKGSIENTWHSGHEKYSLLLKSESYQAASDIDVSDVHMQNHGNVTPDPSLSAEYNTNGFVIESANADAERITASSLTAIGCISGVILTSLTDKVCRDITLNNVSCQGNRNYALQTFLGTDNVTVNELTSIKSRLGINIGQDSNDTKMLKILVADSLGYSIDNAGVGTRMIGFHSSNPTIAHVRNRMGSLILEQYTRSTTEETKTNIITLAGTVTDYSSVGKGNSVGPEFNMLQDSGRNCVISESKNGTLITNWAENTFTQYQSVIAAGPKFSSNNSDYGGPTIALDPIVAAFCEKYKDASTANKRYGTEFFLTKVTKNVSTLSPLTAEGQTFYLSATTKTPICSNLGTDSKIATGFYVYAAVADTVAVTALAHYIEGEPNSINKILPVGWSYINSHATSKTGIVNLFNILYAKDNAVYYIALPFVCRSNVEITRAWAAPVPGAS